MPDDWFEYDFIDYIMEFFNNGFYAYCIEENYEQEFSGIQKISHEALRLGHGITMARAMAKGAIREHTDKVLTILGQRVEENRLHHGRRLFAMGRVGGVCFCTF